MTNLHLSELVFALGFVAYVVIRGIYDHRAAANREKKLSKFHGLEKLLLIPVGIGSLILPLVYLFTSWLDFANYSLPAALPWIGAPLMLFALWLFRRSHADLGRNFSMMLELQSSHQLVKHGVYRYLRHPMYSAIFLFDIAQGLLLHNWLAGWFAFLSFGMMYLARVAREEQMMRAAFGKEYEDYSRTAGRLIPKWRGGRM